MEPFIDLTDSAIPRVNRYGRRQLRASWTMEAAQDLRAIHNISDRLISELFPPAIIEEVTGKRINWKECGF